MFKKILISIALLSTFNLVQADTLNSEPPLNKYGAVDANAKVPLSVQVPELTADFQLPALNPLSEIWPNLVPKPPTFNATAYILMDAQSGSVIAEANGNKRIAPASITKLMLIYLTEQAIEKNNLHLNDIVTIPEIAWATAGSRMFLKPNDQVSVWQLIQGVIVDSGNDAAVALAIHLAGSQEACVSLMNQTAEKLGMTNTHFTDVMGLPAPNHYSSARDLAIMAQAMIQQYPQNQAWFAQKSFTYNKIRQFNYNQLLFIYPESDGMKTGSTDTSGFSLLSTAKLGNENFRLIAVVIGTRSGNESATISKALLMYGFRFFQSTSLYPKTTALATYKVKKGAEKMVSIGSLQDVSVITPRNSKEPLSAQIRLPEAPVAPISQGQTLGSIEIKQGDQVIAREPAVALTAVNTGNFWQRLIH